MVCLSIEQVDPKIVRVFVCLLLLLSVCGSSVAETLPVTVWQKESRWQPKQGDTLKLNRGPFTLVIPLAPGEDVGLLAAEGKRPDPFTGFDPGHGMAGPYDGLFLSWQGFHYFHIDSEGPRADLWDRQKNRYYWKAKKLYRNYSPGEVENLKWDEANNLTLIFRKDGFEDLTVYVNWVDY